MDKTVLTKESGEAVSSLQSRIKLTFSLIMAGMPSVVTDTSL
jgi:hypothetical protein